MTNHNSLPDDVRKRLEIDCHQILMEMVTNKINSLKCGDFQLIPVAVLITMNGEDKTLSAFSMLMDPSNSWVSIVDGLKKAASQLDAIAIAAFLGTPRPSLYTYSLPDSVEMDYILVTRWGYSQFHTFKYNREDGQIIILDQPIRAYECPLNEFFGSTIPGRVL